MKAKAATPIVNDQRDAVVGADFTKQPVQILKSDLKAVAAGAIAGG